MNLTQKQINKAKHIDRLKDIEYEMISLQTIILSILKDNKQKDRIIENEREHLIKKNDIRDKINYLINLYEKENYDPLEIEIIFIDITINLNKSIKKYKIEYTKLLNPK